MFFFFLFTNKSSVAEETKGNVLVGVPQIFRRVSIGVRLDQPKAKFRTSMKLSPQAI